MPRGRVACRLRGGTAVLGGIRGQPGGIELGDLRRSLPHTNHPAAGRAEFQVRVCGPYLHIVGQCVPYGITSALAATLTGVVGLILLCFNFA